MKTYKKWTQEELDYIKNNYQKIKDKDLAIFLTEKSGFTVTINMVRRQRRNLGTEKQRGRIKNEKNICADSSVS